MGKGVMSVGAVTVLALVAGCKTVEVGSDGARPGEQEPRSAAPAPGAQGARTPAPGQAPPAGQSPATGQSPAAGQSPPAARTPPPAPGPSGAPAPKILMRQGDRSLQVRALQARLRQIGWLPVNPSGLYGPLTVNGVKGFQARRGLPPTGAADAVTWQRLLAMSREPTRDELYAGGGMPPAPPDKRCMTGRVLCLAKSSRTLTWMIDGRVVSTMDVRFGSQYTPTREGTFTVYWKSRHHVSTLYDTAMPYAMFFSGGQAVHYSADFATRGYAGGSHGCVNVRDEQKIANLFAQVRMGDRVVIYK
ncbi:murein L,D-transpeptidase [Streptomyces sp. G44]|uniref:L,D-transpeptidase family protein n=1 Tax=Streptomyces sp. G44 TaxID=2807632 RepID=UPI0019607529|nr:L,D-transpeptidase family protein [Streptomyces sp. G44]MBM7169580.1 murein L,D-transpeptidase [Streptomyces sp. G44]